MADHLAFTSSTDGLALNANRVLTVELRLADDTVDTADSTTVVWFTQTDGTGAVTGLGPAIASAGIASLTVTGSTAGVVSIRATAEPAIPSETAFIVVAPATAIQFDEVDGLDLGLGDTRTVSVLLVDDNGNITTSDSTTVITLAQTDGDGLVTGLGTVTSAAGQASFTLIAIGRGAVALTATAPSLTAGTLSLNVVDSPTPAGNTVNIAVGPSPELQAQLDALDAAVADPVVSSNITSDATAPSASPGPTVQGGIGILIATWTPLTNADPVTYEVHVSTTSGFTADSTTHLGDTPGSIYTIRQMPDGSALAYGTTYYVVIVAKDIDGSATQSGQGSAQLVQVDSPDIAANAVIASKILAGTITADKLAAVLVLASVIETATSGARCVFDTTGINLYDSGNVNTVKLNAADGSASFQGDVLAHNLQNNTVRAPALTANANDYNPTGLASASVLMVSSDAVAERSITGLAGGSDGREVTLVNYADETGGVSTIRLVNESVSSIAANRFHLSVDLVLNTYSAVTLIYNTTLGRWRVKADYERTLQSKTTAGTLSIGGPLAILANLAAGSLSYTLGSNANDFAPVTASADYTTAVEYKLTASGADRTITGIVPTTADGTAQDRLLFIQNVGGTFDIILTTEDAASSAANRFTLGASIRIRPNQGIVLIYDVVTSRWRMLSDSGNAGPLISPTSTGTATVNAKTVETSVAPASIGANTNDWAPDGGGVAPTHSLYFVTASGAFNITGMVAGVADQIVELFNRSGQILTLTNQDANSTIGNRFLLPGGVNFTWTNGTGIRLVYSGADSRWRMIAQDIVFATATPAMDGVAALGTTGLVSDAGHVHPTDTSRAPTASPTFTGTVTAADIVSSGKITSSSATLGIGYATGAGGTATQATSITTGVTLSKITGKITLFSGARASQVTNAFTLTNTTIAATDTVIVEHISGGTLGAYNFAATPAAGSATISVRNVHTASLTEAPVIKVTVIKSVEA